MCVAAPRGQESRRARRVKAVAACLALACLAAAWGCSGPGRDGAPAGAEPSGARTEGEATSDAAPWEACLEGPSRIAECERHVSRSREDPDLPRRLAALAAAHPRRWFPLYLEGYRHLRRGEHREASEILRAAVEKARAASDPLGEGTALYALAAALEASGDASRVEPLLAEARAAADRSGDRRLKRRVLRWLAARRQAEGRYFDERALRLEELAAADSGRNDEAYRKALHELADSTRRLGLHGEAERGFRRALDLAREAGDAAAESAAGMALGILALDSADGRALELLEGAKAAAARGARPDVEAYAEMVAGVALIRAGRFEEARARLTENLARPECSRHNLRFRTLVYLAEAEWRSGDGESALGRYREILAASAGLDLPEEERDALMGLAALRRARGEPEAAADAARRAVDLVESMRFSIPVLSERTHFLRIRSDTYRILAASLADLDPTSLAEPFEVLERAHARTLREALSAAPPLSDEDRALTLPEAQRLLGPRDLLVEFLLGEDESSLLAVDARRATFHPLPPRREIEERVEAYRKILLRPLGSPDARLSPETDFRRFARTGHELFRDLLGPVAERLEGVERLIVVPDRRLHLLPFEALLVRPPEDGRPLEFLGASLAIEYLPAASFLEPPEKLQDGRVVVVAADRGRADLDLAPLRHAAEEAEAVAAAYPPDRTVVLAGDDACVERLEEACTGPVRTLHLTAHAVLDPALGPRIALHPSGGGDGWLDRDGIARLRSAPRLIVLSACDTAMGELVGGEGILGLVRAFTAAGSRQIVASLWNVDDARAASLMGRVHREMRSGASPSTAMRNARQAILAEGFVHPFQWAGLVLYGSD
mgnify:CR=1 FL=1